ncbi:MAG TPA: BON domain-containing protein [Dissulfurispiraceae bacterium]
MATRTVPAVKTDDDIKRDVTEQLYWDGRVDASNIRVEVSGGTVRLDGAVPSYSARQAAYVSALSVPGVASVENNLIVRYPEGAAKPADNDIKSSIENIFKWSADVDPKDVAVSVSAGAVTLRGAVGSYWQKIRAEELAANVGGVLGVTDELAVVPTEEVSDSSIGDYIMAALDRIAEIDPNTLDVKVENGVVTLSGRVPDWGMYHTVRDIARYTPGVVNVIDYLIVGYR